MVSVLAPLAARRRSTVRGLTGYTGQPASSRKAISNPWVVSMMQAICSFCSGPVMVSRKVLSLASLAASVIDSKRPSLVSLLVKHQGVMVRICPIDSSIPHRAVPSLQVTFLSPRALLLCCSKHDFLIIGFTQEQRQGSASFLNRSSREEKRDFPWRV